MQYFNKKAQEEIKIFSDQESLVYVSSVTVVAIETYSMKKMNQTIFKVNRRKLILEGFFEKYYLKLSLYQLA